MSNVNNVTVGKPKIGGAAFCAPIGTPLPSDPFSPLNKAFKCLGYVSEDGLVNANSPEHEDVKAWGGDIVLTPQTGKPDTWKYKLIEATNPEVLKAVYGPSNVTGESLKTGIHIKANSKQQPPMAWVFDMILRNDVPKRVCIPSASITEVSEIAYKDNEPVGYEITINAEPNADGDTHEEYIGGTAPTLGTLTVQSTEGTSEGKSKITVTPPKAEGGAYKTKIGAAEAPVAYGQDVSDWEDWNGTTEVEGTKGQTITVVETDADGWAIKAGSAALTIKEGE